jgi:hypothetical protein
MLRAGWGTVSRAIPRIPCKSFWYREEDVVNTVHGALVTHCVGPFRVVAELQKEQFQDRVVATIIHTRVASVPDWYYYVFSKSN